MPMAEVPIPAFAALISSFLWAAASVYSFQTVKEIGPVRFNTYRVIIGFVMLWAIMIVMGELPVLDWRPLIFIMLSGAVGVFLGDILRYATLVRLGPRRTVVFMAMSSPIVIVFGALMLNEILSAWTYGGLSLILVAVLVTGLFDIKGDHNNKYETITGVAYAGIAIGLVAAVFQASGILLAKLALIGAYTPLQATSLRISGAFVAAVLYALATRRVGTLFQVTGSQLGRVAVSTLAAMVCGTVILIYALKNAPVSIVTVFQSMVPVFITVIVWVVMRRRPNLVAAISVIAVVCGVVAISWR